MLLVQVDTHGRVYLRGAMYDVDTHGRVYLR